MWRCVVLKGIPCFGEVLLLSSVSKITPSEYTLCRARWIQSFTLYFFQNYFNIIVHLSLIHPRRLFLSCFPSRIFMLGNFQQNNNILNITSSTTESTHPSIDLSIPLDTSLCHAPVSLQSAIPERSAVTRKLQITSSTSTVNVATRILGLRSQRCSSQAFRRNLQPLSSQWKIRVKQVRDKKGASPSLQPYPVILYYKFKLKNWRTLKYLLSYIISWS
jgi:hypothetical protein